MHRTLIISLLLGLLAPTSPIYAGLIFQRSMSVNRSVNFFDTDQFDLDLTLGDRPFNPSNLVTLFDGISISPSDVGSSYTVSSGDALFAAADLRLSDALDENISVVLTEDQPSGRTEQRDWPESLFFFDPATLSAYDLAGATLESIEVSVDQFTLVSGSPLAATSGPPVDLLLTISFFGSTIPEPASIWILSTGLATLGIWRRKAAEHPTTVLTQLY